MENKYINKTTETINNLKLTLKQDNCQTSFKVGDSIINNKNLTIIGGPCAVENSAQLSTIAKELKNLGINIMRAGLFKPRTSPYSFQGLKLEGVALLEKIKSKYNLQIISEVTDKEQLTKLLPLLDIVQVGARNMQNFELLKALGKINKPVLLKRGFGNTVDEWLMSAEYILSGGNKEVILCERGIRTFDNFHTRATLDISSIILAKKMTHLPVFVDPSHALGRWDLILDASLAAVAAGADGLLIEVHHQPSIAYSDGEQSLTLENFKKLVKQTQRLKAFLTK